MRGSRGLLPHCAVNQRLIRVELACFFFPASDSKTILSLFSNILHGLELPFSNKSLNVFEVDDFLTTVIAGS